MNRKKIKQTFSDAAAPTWSCSGEPEFADASVGDVIVVFPVVCVRPTRPGDDDDVGGDCSPVEGPPSTDVASLGDVFNGPETPTLDDVGRDDDVLDAAAAE